MQRLWQAGQKNHLQWTGKHEKAILKLILKKCYKNAHRGQGPAVVFGNCGNEHPGNPPPQKKKPWHKRGHHISYITATFQLMYEGKHIIIYTIHKDKYTKKKMSPMCISHINHTSMHLAWPNGLHKAHFFVHVCVCVCVCIYIHPHIKCVTFNVSQWHTNTPSA